MVATTASWFARQLNEPLHRVAYMPNNSVEGDCGFDLSIGFVNTPYLRLRMLCKSERSFCDQPFADKLLLDGDSANQKTNEKERSYRHVRLLLETFHKSHGACLPFILFQQCYCLHDFRRMGITLTGGVVNPDVEDSLRSLCVKLDSTEFIAAFEKNTSFTISATSNPNSGSVSVEAQFGYKTTMELETATLGSLVELVRNSKQ